MCLWWNKNEVRIIQGGSKGHVQTARVSVPGHEGQELHRNWFLNSIIIAVVFQIIIIFKPMQV